jgi:(S)-mandelate dehydrogenase
MGLADLIRPAADVAMANVANRAGIPFIQSGASFTRYENLPHGGDAPPWYQIYVYEEEAAVATLARLSQNGCENVMVTVDMPVGGVRHRDLANHFGPRISATMFLQSCARPMWQFRHARARLMSPVPRSPLPTAIAQRRFDKPLSWDHLRRLREAWRGRFWIKGLLHPEDAVRAAEMGFDGVVASNHGGRQLDLSPSAWRMLSEMRSALPDGYPLMADGGVRSGEDIARAIALGASAVLIGRPVLYALAAAGEDGVAKMVARLHHEFDVAMRLLGCQTVAGLGAFPAFSKHRCGLE